MPLSLSTPVRFIKRIGDRVAAGLADRGILTIEDLLYHLPFRYEDRLHPKPLSLYHPGDMASLVGEVRGTTLLRTRSGPIFEMTVGITPPAPTQTLSSRPESASFAPNTLSSRPESAHFADAAERPAVLPGTPPWVSTDPTMTGLLNPRQPILETVKCMWFHGTYLKDKFRPGQKIALYGKLEGSRSGNALHAPPGSVRFKLIQPTFEILPDEHATGESGSPTSGARRGEEDAEFILLEMGRIVPVYESLGGKTPWGAKLTSRWHRRVIWTIFRDLAESDALQETPSSRPEPSTFPPRNLSSRPKSALSADAAERPVVSSSGTHPPGAPFVTAPSSRVGSQDIQLPTDTLPTALRQRLRFPTRMDALRDLHFPPAGTSITELMSARTPAHRRLIFEEFFYLELGLELKRRRLRERSGTACTTNDQVREALKQILPFKPTAAQKRVLGEIVTDMRRSQPMRRLLQGDVGSGKTIVAFQAALIAIENGYQVALMAPTEILATQHYLSARKLLSEKISPRTQRPYRIALLTGSLDDRTKRDTRARLFRGEIDLIIGTHALVEDNVDFANLGLVIVDEQHRFGVQQRFQLTRKPNTGSASTSLPIGPQSPSPSTHHSTQDDPDVLVMTATPIPRTLALTLYGDLEASVIDELPPGRTPIQTRRMPEERSAEVWNFVRKQVTAGRQAYIVYPIIEGVPDDQPELDFATDPDTPALSDPTPQTSSSRPNRAPSNLSSRPNSAPTQNLSPRPKSAPTQNLSSRPKSALFADAAERPAASLRAATKSAPKRNPTRPKLRSATDMHAELQAGPLAGLRLGLLHGRMSADDKEVTMARFKRGELDVLVATTVIEVGVDVPNATVMVIEHAERFGLAQLHQLRGRVGRGAAKSFCVLLTGASITPEAELRLDAMVRTQNGFELAEFDLQQRGPGEFFGTRQAGLPDLRVANLARDRDLLELARVEAAHFAAAPDPAIPRPEIDAVWSRLKHQWQRRYGLLEA